MFYWPFYTRGGTYTHDSTATEVNTYTTGLANFTEILHEDYSFSNTGDSVTGDYTNTINDGLHSSTLEAFTTNGSGDFTVTQSMEGDFERTTIGNAVSGEYLITEEATDDYTVNQIDRDGPYFDLEMVGSNSYTDKQEGNQVTGEYIRTKNGTDIFTITITGVKNEDDYEQLVTGTEQYTLQDTGNSGTGLYTREIDVDESSYTRTSTGAGSEMPSDSGSTDYHWEQTGDQQSGTFDLTQTGTDRYDLLEDFFDISNTESGQTPGHMNVYPFAQTFVDPFPSQVDPERDSNGNWIGRGLPPSMHIPLLPIQPEAPRLHIPLNPQQFAPAMPRPSIGRGPTVEEQRQRNEDWYFYNWGVILLGPQSHPGLPPNVITSPTGQRHETGMLWKILSGANKKPTPWAPGMPVPVDKGGR